jgi:methylisocitrate lyase
VILPAVWDVVSARAADLAGARALFLSGSALAASFGFPDIGLVSADDLVRVTRRIRDATDLPLIVDAECGFGGPDQLARAARRLREAGASGLLIEDQEFTGQSVSPHEAALCAPEAMVERVRIAKAATGRALVVLARSDVVGADWSFAETLRRLELYRDAGADWVTAVYVRSRDELERAAQIGRCVAIAVRGATGYVPDPADAFVAGCAGVIVTGFLQATFEELRRLYSLVQAGDLPSLRARQPDPATFASAMRFERFLPPRG